MLTVDTIQQVTARLKDPEPLRHLGMQSRALAFAIDFLLAADCDASSLNWLDAQAIVRARILQLFQDLQLSFVARVRPGTASAEMSA